MPLPFIHSTNSLFGIAYTGFRGLILGGTWTGGSTTISGPLPVQSGVALVQPGNVCSTAGVQAQIISTSTSPVAVSLANYVYIPQTTGPFATSSMADGEKAPPFSQMGAALIWDAAGRRLGVYSSAGGAGTWFFSHAGITTSAGAAGFTSS